jgi:hypothetical protein
MGTSGSVKLRFEKCQEIWEMLLIGENWLLKQLTRTHASATPKSNKD